MMIWMEFVQGKSRVSMRLQKIFLNVTNILIIEVNYEYLILYMGRLKIKDLLN